MPRRVTEPTTPGHGNVIDMRTGEAVKQPAIPVICERIRHYRKQKGLEQKAFGERIGAAANTVNNWEKGRTRPDVSFLPRICEALGITLRQLYGLEGPEPGLSAREERLIGIYRGLDEGHRTAVDALAGTLLRVQEAQAAQAGGRKVHELPLYSRALAAGIGDPTGYEAPSEPFYLYDVPRLDRADGVFRVNGDSMEPAYRDGDYVLIERIPDAPGLKYGETGAFAVGNELYIKQYGEDGLHSLNAAYPVMRFGEDTRVFLIGRVLGAVPEEARAREEDVRAYLTLKG